MHRIKTEAARLIITVIVLGCSASFAQTANAAIVFTNVVDTTTTAPGHGAFMGFGLPSVSGSNLAFRGIYSGASGDYTGTVGAAGATKVVDTSDTAPGHGAFTGANDPSINGSNLAFVGSYSGGSGIYTGIVGSTGATKIVDIGDTAPGHGVFTIFPGTPSISGNNLAFRGLYSGGSGFYTGIVGTAGATKVVDTGDTAPGHSAFTGFGVTSSLSGNNIAFRGQYTGGSGIYTGTVGTTGATKVVDTDDTAPGHSAYTSFGVTPSVSGSNLAFYATFAGGAGIYAANVGATGAIKIVDTNDIAPGHGAFTDFGNLSTSGSNVAFTGVYSGGLGLYIIIGGAGGSLTPLLSTGDALFGSTVTDFSLSSFSYDNNTIAFEYSLANFRTGIATVVVPEPASMSMLIFAGRCLKRRRR